jgi:hypothetical protein
LAEDSAATGQLDRERAVLYRAVSRAEWEDIQTTRRFRAAPFRYEGKLFASSPEDALFWVHALYVQHPEDAYVIQITIPQSAIQNLYHGAMDPGGRVAIYVGADELQEFNDALIEVGLWQHVTNR